MVYVHEYHLEFGTFGNQVLLYTIHLHSGCGGQMKPHEISAKAAASLKAVATTLKVNPGRFKSHYSTIILKDTRWIEKIMKLIQKVGNSVKLLIIDNFDLTVDKFQKRTLKELKLAEAIYAMIVDELGE